jgi:D-alanine-D-alanine ligase-like ATP-grasp enzyme
MFSWIDALVDRIMPVIRIPRWADTFLDLLIERIWLLTFLVEMRDNFPLSEIQARSACFVAEAQNHGITFQAAYGPAGYTGNFCANISGREARFNVLPTADHLSQYDPSFTSSKEHTKQHLKKGGFPVAQGRAFFFYQKRQALKFGCETLDFPLVVKPQYGSVARHVTTNIQSRETLKKAIDSAVRYSPAFIVERFIKDSAVYRATVVNFEFVAVVKQIPANVCGDGKLAIKELVERKDKARERKESSGLGYSSVLHKVTINDTTDRLLGEQGHTLNTVPEEEEVVYLQADPFLTLGGDLAEVTEATHPENLQLFKDIAKFFDMRLVGIDFIAPDINASFTSQQCAVLELNSVPCIELHHFPSSGRPQNVAGALVDLFSSAYF